MTQTSFSKKIKKEIDFSFKSRKIKLKIIGLGGGGNAIISEMAKTLKSLNFFALDNDPRSFKGLSKKIKIFQLPQQFSQEEKILKEKIKKILQDADLTILITCLGGHLSSNFLPIFTQILNQEKILSLGIFILPFSFEDERKILLAKNNLKEFKENFSGVIILENDKVLKQKEKNIPLRKSFSLINQVLINYLQDFLEIISEVGIINIDFADFQTILSGKGQLIYFSQGKGQGPTRIEEALKELLENPFLALPLRIKKMLFNIKAGPDLTLKEVEKIGEEIFSLNPQAKIIFGIFQDPKLEKKIKINLLAAGGDFIKEKKKEEKEEKKEIKKEVQIKKKKERKIIKKERKFKVQRRSALEIKKLEKKKKEIEENQETKWEIPSFLRNIKI